jgi:hypothetical protein
MAKNGEARVMEWLIVLSDQEAAEWVLDNQRMAFRANTNADRLTPGDPVAVYLSGSAFRKYPQQPSRIVALARVATPLTLTPVEVAGQPYASSCGLAIEARLPFHKGLPFPPLIDRLSFIRKKHAWASYVHRTIVALGEGDFAIIQAEFLDLMTDEHDDHTA